MRTTILALLLATAAFGQDEYRVYTEHPRLFLTPQRLRLLKRERDRDSMRWRQFDLLVRAAAQMREPGFALALHYAVSGDAASASGRWSGRLDRARTCGNWRWSTIGASRC